MTNTVMLLGRDSAGRTNYVRSATSVLYSVTITAAGGAISLTVPSNTLSARWDVLFSSDPGASVWVSINGTAALPAGSTFASTTSELNPVGYRLKAGDTISVITSNTTVNLGVAMYVVQQ